MIRDPIRILIADDHAVVRKGLAMVLKLEDDIEVVGEAGDGLETIEAAKNIKPDLVLLDLMMPNMDGSETAKKLRENHPDIKIIILTGTTVTSSAVEIVAAGINGYLLKEIEPSELKQAIRVVMEGETYLHPSVTRQMINFIQEPPSPDIKSSLTKRELEVLSWIATSKTYKEIADELSISEETIRSHAKNILAKLGQPNRAQAVLAAIKAGLIDLPADL